MITPYNLKARETLLLSNFENNIRLALNLQSLFLTRTIFYIFQLLSDLLFLKSALIVIVTIEIE